MAKCKLTQKIIDNAVCPEGTKYMYIMDKDMKGFGIRVMDTGMKLYIIRFQYKGRRISRSFAPVKVLSVSAARSRASVLIGKYMEGEDPLAVVEKKNTSKLTIRQLYAKWEKWAKEQRLERRSTKAMIGAIALHFNVDKKLAESLTARDLENYKNECTKKGNQPSSVNRILRELKYLYSWANTQGLLSEDFKYPEGVKRLSEAMISPKEHHLSDVEVDKLLEETDKLIAKRPNLAYILPIIEFALNTGIRIHSIVQLEWRDVLRLENDRGELNIRAACIKTRRDVKIPISEAAVEILKELQAKGEHAETDRIFTNLTVSWINQLIKKIMVSAGLGKYSAYSLRHNYATSLYLEGVDPFCIMRQMGHQEITTTQKYVHMDFDHQIEAAANRLNFRRHKPKEHAA